MPRLTFNEYLIQRVFLKLAWEEFDQLYSLLPTNQQWDLHRYYQPLSDHTTDELKGYRAYITRLEPSLPARAGRLHAQLHRVYEQAIEALEQPRAGRRPTSSKAPRTRALAGRPRITVRAIARPEPDLHKFSQALIALAEQMAREEKSR